MSAVLWEDLKADIKLAAYRYSSEKATCAKAGKRLLTKTLKILIVEESLRKTSKTAKVSFWSCSRRSTAAPWSAAEHCFWRGMKSQGRYSKQKSASSFAEQDCDAAGR